MLFTFCNGWGGFKHLYPSEVPKALAEFRRILKPDGFVVITCPDLQSVCKLVADDKLTETAYQSVSGGPITPLDIIYGHRISLAKGQHFMAHRCGFTQKVLIRTLKAAGFVMIASLRRDYPHFDLYALATQNPMSEAHFRTLVAAHFPNPDKR
jgi:ubiquinone/menaquinone biosynthesis C-methylase UbiE